MTFGGVFNKIAKFFACLLCWGCLVSTLSSCTTIDDDRIPSMPVNINLSTPDLWATYGVAGYGQSRRFILSLREPRNFPFTDRTTTGYGGVLLISGVDPFTFDAGVPLAYDLSCPVECKPDIRVAMQPVGPSHEAVCPDCGSRYDVIERGGSPTDGPAKQRKLGLRRYDCRQSGYGGYLITNSF